jgi:hypothetical protein
MRKFISLTVALAILVSLASTSQFQNHEREENETKEVHTEGLVGEDKKFIGFVGGLVSTAIEIGTTHKDPQSGVGKVIGCMKNIGGLIKKDIIRRQKAKRGQKVSKGPVAGTANTMKNCAKDIALFALEMFGGGVFGKIGKLIGKLGKLIVKKLAKRIKKKLIQKKIIKKVMQKITQKSKAAKKKGTKIQKSKAAKKKGKKLEKKTKKLKELEDKEERDKYRAPTFVRRVNLEKIAEQIIQRINRVRKGKSLFKPSEKKLRARFRSIKRRGLGKSLGLSSKRRVGRGKSERIKKTRQTDKDEIPPLPKESDPIHPIERDDKQVGKVEDGVQIRVVKDSRKVRKVRGKDTRTFIVKDVDGEKEGDGVSSNVESVETKLPPALRRKTQKFHEVALPEDIIDDASGGKVGQIVSKIVKEKLTPGKSQLVVSKSDDNVVHINVINIQHN